MTGTVRLSLIQCLVLVCALVAPCGCLEQGWDSADSDAASAHTPFPDSTSSVWIEWIDGELLSTADALDRIREYFRHKPPTAYFGEPYSQPLRQDEVTRAQELLEERLFRAFGFEPFVYPYWPTWSEDPFESRMWMRQWQILNWIDPLLRVHELSDQISPEVRSAYWNEYRRLLLHWIGVNVPQTQEYLTWHDEGSAQRTQYLLRVFDHLRTTDQMDDVMFSEVLRALRYHADRQLDPSFYSQHGNHGLSQSQALAVAGSVLSDLPEADEWLETGLERIRDEIAYAIIDNSVHNEHSPSYHLMVINILRNLNQAALAFEWPLDDLSTTIRNMESVFAHFLTPTLEVPLIGDSKRWWSSSETENVHPHLRYVITRGAEGVAPASIALFRSAGYAILRDRFAIDEDFQQSFFVFFTAAVHSTSHKQRDDLSFVLWAHGENWLTDQGLYSYNYDDPYCGYAYATRAHNTILVDGEDWPLVTASFGHSEILSLESDAGVHVLTARHDLYRDIEIRRTLRYQEPDQVTVIDEMRSPAQHDYAQLWHLNPDHTHRIEGNRVVVCGGGTHAMLMTLEGVDSVDSVHGQEAPEPWGWHYPEAGVRVPSTVIIGRRSANDARIETTVTFASHSDWCAP